MWATNRKGQPMYAWAAVPPSKDFVALGMVFTTTDSPPPLEAMCCAPLRALKPAVNPPQLVWTDKGSTGRPGSCWIVNDLKLAFVVAGHEVPKGPFYDFVAPDFTLKN